MTETHFNSDDYEPAKGELRIMDGKLAMYVNSNSYGASSGSPLGHSWQPNALHTGQKDGRIYLCHLP